MKFDTCTNSNMLNSMVLSILPDLDLKNPFWTNSFQKNKIVYLMEIPFLGKFSLKYQNCYLKLKFGA